MAIHLAILTQKHFLLAGESGGQKHRYTYTETQLITQKDLLQWRPETLLCLHRNIPYLQVEVVAINLAIFKQTHHLLADESGDHKLRYTYTETLPTCRRK